MTPFIGLFTSAEISKMSKDKFNVKRALWNANEERPSQESRIFDSKIHHPPSQKIYPIFLHRTSHVSRLKSGCLRNRDKKVALTVARGKTRWLAKTNVQSPSKKIQYPTPLKKEGGGEEKERNERRKRIFSPNVENRTFEQWYTLLTRHTRDKQRQKKYSPTREGGEGVSGARFKPGSNRIRAYRCPGVCQKREENSVSIMIRRERERERKSGIDPINLSSLSASLETQSVKSQPDRLTQFTGHRSHRDMYTRQSECALT